MKRTADHVKQVIDHCTWAIDYALLESKDKAIIDELMILKASAERLLKTIEEKQSNQKNKSGQKNAHQKFI